MDPTVRACVDDLEALVVASLTPGPSSDSPGAIGLESEHFLIHTDDVGRPQRRATVQELHDLLDSHPGLRAEAPDPVSLTGWHDGRGARFLAEPGAQVEYAGPPHATGRGALEALTGAMQELAAVAQDRGIAVVSAGLDLWHAAEAVPQQLSAPRYPAMSAYLKQRSIHGHTMMANSASLQVNLDLGAGDRPTRRWTAALLASPLTTATFACSPTPGSVSGRATVWRWLDESRTGIPKLFSSGTDDPAAVLVAAAMDADVLLFSTDDGVHPGQQGFTLATWLEEGHPVYGHPTVSDVAYHLTTLFPEIRTRGFLEVRGIDSLPDRWRMVPVVLLAGLLYDDYALDTVRDILEPYRHRLPILMDRAAHLGLSDGELCALAVGIWTTAAEGARRLGPDYFDVADVQRAERFLDHFTLRGRSPSDELRERLAVGPAQALDWAREPVGALRAC